MALLPIGQPYNLGEMDRRQLMNLERDLAVLANDEKQLVYLEEELRALAQAVTVRLNHLLNLSKDMDKGIKRVLNEEVINQEKLAADRELKRRIATERNPRVAAEMEWNWKKRLHGEENLFQQTALSNAGVRDKVALELQQLPEIQRLLEQILNLLQVIQERKRLMPQIK